MIIKDKYTETPRVENVRIQKRSCLHVWRSFRYQTSRWMLFMIKLLWIVGMHPGDSLGVFVEFALHQDNYAATARHDRHRPRHFFLSILMT